MSRFLYTADIGEIKNVMFSVCLCVKEKEKLGLSLSVENKKMKVFRGRLQSIIF